MGTSDELLVVDPCEYTVMGDPMIEEVPSADEEERMQKQIKHNVYLGYRDKRQKRRTDKLKKEGLY